MSNESGATKGSRFRGSEKACPITKDGRPGEIPDFRPKTLALLAHRREHRFRFGQSRLLVVEADFELGNLEIPALVDGTLPQHRVTKLSPRPAERPELTTLFEESMQIW